MCWFVVWRYVCAHRQGSVPPRRLHTSRLHNTLTAADDTTGANNMVRCPISIHPHLACRVPSMAIPIKSVKFPESGVPTSILMYGVEDRPLYGLALALEASLTA